MKGVVRVRRAGGIEEFSVEADPDTPVTGLLEKINAELSNPIEWECSCGQNLCGACAMIINGVPNLACSTMLGEAGPVITLEPLSKFPLIADLRVDRSCMYTTLTDLKLWLEENETAETKDFDLQYAAASCIQCGCCLEVCPNYTGHDAFSGAFAMNAASKIIMQIPAKKRRGELARSIARRTIADCSKSLSCESICPAKIPLSLTIARLNRQYLIRILEK